MRFEKYLKLAKGFRGRGKNCRRVMANRVETALRNQYIGRKLKKRDQRSVSTVCNTSIC